MNKSKSDGGGGVGVGVGAWAQCEGEGGSFLRTMAEAEAEGGRAPHITARYRLLFGRVSVWASQTIEADPLKARPPDAAGRESMRVGEGPGLP
jgi:hypothetical protein